MRDDGRLRDAKAKPILEVADRLGVDKLRPAGHERVGPCPVCGGRDRFGINPGRGVFLCRVCNVGGDVVQLVRHVQGCTLPQALDYLLGEAPAQIDPAELERRRKLAEAAEAKRQELEATMRARAIRDAREIWHAAQPGADSPAAAYLAGRGIRFPSWPPTLRFLPDHPYSLKRAGHLAERYRGPCMVAAIQDARGRITAVHQTWIDPGNPGQKAQVGLDEAGQPLIAKLVRGSKKGGAIRLSPLGPSGQLIMGEGIETTASALVAGVAPGAAFWAGVDLGNMAGRQVKLAGTRYSGLPDMADGDAFVPPAGIVSLGFIQDGDSDPADTRAKLLAGIRRAQALRPGLRGWIAHAGEGADLNDVLTNKKSK